MSHNYGDPCANDVEHGAAVVGITKDGQAHWVCMDCFEAYLAEARQLIKTALEESG